MTDEVIEAPQEVITPQEPQQIEAQPTQEAPTEDQPKEAPKEEALPKGVQRRIDRAVRQKYEAEARAKMLEERLSAVESRQAQQPQQQMAQGEPRLEDFDNFDAYIAAKAEFVADRKIQQTLAEREKRQEAERAQTARQQTVAGWNKRVAAAEGDLPDFHDVVSSSDVRMTPPMAGAIMESEHGPKLAYYLATHPDEADAISDMSPVAAVRALTRIEDKLISQPAQVTKTPPPTSPVGVKAKATKDPADMSFEEFSKWRTAQVGRRR